MQQQMQGGLLGAAPQGPAAPEGGLLGAAPQGQQGDVQMPPEMAQIIESVKDAPLETKQAVLAKFSELIMAADRPQNIKQAGIQMLREGLGL